MTARRGFTPPVQERSEKTLERLLLAARTALRTRRFAELTLAELTREAGVTVGAFYQRFPSKAALLELLEQEAYEEMRKGSAAMFRVPPGAGGRTIADLIRVFVTGMAHIYQEHRGVLREIVQRSRADATRQSARMEMTGDVVASAVDWMLQHDGTIGHPEPKRALGIALLFVTSALRDVILFDERWASPDLGVDVLVDELVHAVEAYLRLPTAARP